ncbi:ABC transporter ATP-binding protein [Haladaptatus sp. DYSN1]|uniref:ABC transporter ATP-binding protein n=1 Tax=unclassified Haladaptatus TaxID=2622732 RepID=UPI00240605CA|nr:ABC transporter ATP-binding protein [Haladaptatus sp. DYSN1]
MTDVLVCEDVQRKYGDTVALDGVSLTVADGEVFALIGPNGAGKTTLVRALTGTTDAEGTISVFGDPPAEADRARIGLLPQSFDPPERLTPRELLHYYAGLYEEGNDPDDLLSLVGLEESADTWYEKLSGGQQRRTCVAIALVNDPDLLFLDEPTTGIDPAGRRAIWGLLEDLVASGTTLFLTTHYMEEAHRLADRVGLLSAGKLVEVGPPNELVADYGGESRLTFETSAQTADLAGTGYRVEASEHSLTIFDVPPEQIGEVVAALEARGVTYDALSWSQPTLEDVYLRLTGSSFADDDALAEPEAAR